MSEIQPGRINFLSRKPTEPLPALTESALTDLYARYNLPPVPSDLQIRSVLEQLLPPDIRMVDLNKHLADAIRLATGGQELDTETLERIRQGFISPVIPGRSYADLMVTGIEAGLSNRK